MDHQRFDALTVALASGTSRRRVLRALAAGAIAGLGLRRGAGASSALAQGACPAGQTSCGVDLVVCADLASDLNHCGACNNVCVNGSSCAAGTCIVNPCDPGLTNCEYGCTDLATDPYNCGWCSNLCPLRVCTAGSCDAVTQSDCPAGLINCGFDGVVDIPICVDLVSDPNHCGSCFNVCASGFCEARTCVGECPVGLIGCFTVAGTDTGTESSITCTTLEYDEFNCGACGNVCASGACQFRTCFSCEPGLSICIEETYYCANLSSDPNNCGGCRQANPTMPSPCPSGVCNAGVCTSNEGCERGFTNCDGGCINLSVHSDHCGACNNVCGGICTDGMCYDDPEAVPCDPGFTNCSGNCFNLSTNPNQCGACGFVCASGMCNEGTCAEGSGQCRGTQTDCSGRCVFLSSDHLNCGACGRTCPDSVFCHTCVEGVCQPIPDGAQSRPSDGETRTCCGAQIYQTGFEPSGCLTPPETGCDEDQSECGGACVDLESDTRHCGGCDIACDAGEACRQSQCVPTPTRTPAPPSIQTATQDRERDRDQGRGRDRDQDQERDRGVGRDVADDSVLGWPFDPADGPWAISNGYRGEADHAEGPDDETNYMVFGLDFARCHDTAVDAAGGVCGGDAGGDSGGGLFADDPGNVGLFGDATAPDEAATTQETNWDRAATRGVTVLSPVDGTVAWTDDSDADCRGIGVAIDGDPGHRLALFFLDDHPAEGQAVRRGEPIGTVAAGDCRGGGALHLVLYTPKAGDEADPVVGRVGAPFAGEWTIAGCAYPDDERTANQYRGQLAPCRD